MTTSTDASSAAHRPLAGVRVLDLSKYLPGPFCSLQLQWLGAEVTVIEQPPHGDPMRSIPPLDETGTSWSYRSLRRGCEVELLDLGSDAGRERALELARDADVLVESFRPGVAERLGLGPEQLRAELPRLVYCSISGYGQTGPWRNAPGHDLGYEAASGLLEQSGTRADVTPPAVPLADLSGGFAAATSIAAALFARERTGSGVHLDIALAEAGMALQAMSLPGAGTPGTDRNAGMLTGGLASYDVYTCADGERLAVAPIEPKFFARLCELLELEGVAERQYDLTAQRELRTVLAARFAEEPSAHWVELLVGADGGQCCVDLVRVGADAPAHPQLAARGATITLGDGPNSMPASPYVIDGVRSDAQA